MDIFDGDILFIFQIMQKIWFLKKFQVQRDQL